MNFHSVHKTLSMPVEFCRLSVFGLDCLAVQCISDNRQADLDPDVCICCIPYGQTNIPCLGLVKFASSMGFYIARPKEAIMVLGLGSTTIPDQDGSWYGNRLKVALHELPAASAYDFCAIVCLLFVKWLRIYSEILGGVLT
jgi:hypothetical protein